MKQFILLFSILCSASLLNAQTGKVIDKLVVKSKILNMDRNYAIYLPPDYETSKRDYPVLYLIIRFYIYYMAGGR